VADAEEAIRLANLTQFGLGAALWTRDAERARLLTGELQAGVVVVNGVVASNPRLPFGGIKRSGYGRELGKHGIREFTNVKTVCGRPDAARRLVLKPDQVEVFDRGNGVSTRPYVGRWNSDDATITTGTTTFSVGTGLPLHSHNVEESVLVVSGQAIGEIDGEQFELEAGEATWVPAGVPHRFINRGAGELTIYWVYGGREVTRTMTETGVTVVHLSDADRGGGAYAGAV
jgi:succinate-semialdehyde dehydrogenase/glutarate-semialdehyde dehydrogenase